MKPRKRKKPYAAEDYSKLDAVNWSTLKFMRASPLHYATALKRPVADTPAMAVGRATHCLTFEPAKFFGEFAIWRGERRAGEEWSRFLVENPGKTVLKGEDHARAQAIANAVRADIASGSILQYGEAERVIVWQDDETKLWCKGRLDWLCGSVVDLKTTTEIEPRKFAASAYRYGYCHQLAMYRWGVETALGLTGLPCHIIAVESEAPHDVAVYRLSDVDLACALDEVRELLRRVAACRTENRWPGRFATEAELPMPRYAWNDDESAHELGLTINGKAA